MSEIPEFRAWYNNKMWRLAKLDLWGDPDQAICDLAPYLPKYEELYDIYLSDVILMQYTGLKDKNGVDIFEGDILEFDDLGEEGFEYLVGYEFENRALVCFENGRFELGCFLSRNSAVLDVMNKETHEEFIENITESLIVGNIYENPELLDIGEWSN